MLLVLTLVAVMATSVVGLGVAQAATCTTRAHAYVTQPGRIYVAGYEGDTSLGIPTWRTFPGDTFQIGGNGIQPGTTHFTAVDAVGNQVDLGLSDSLPAGENCVANEGPTHRVVAPPGSYRIIAVYTGGNTGVTHVQQVVDAIVEDVPTPVDPGWPPDPIYIW